MYTLEWIVYYVSARSLVSTFIFLSVLALNSSPPSEPGCLRNCTTRCSASSSEILPFSIICATGRQGRKKNKKECIQRLDGTSVSCSVVSEDAKGEAKQTLVEELWRVSWRLDRHPLVSGWEGDTLFFAVTFDLGWLRLVGGQLWGA